MFFSSRLLLCCVLLAAAGLTAPAGADAPKHTMVVQTFEPARNNGTPLVQVRFSNTVIGTFAIDTGEYESVITQNFAKRLNLNAKAYQSAWFGFGLPPATLVQVPQMRMEGLTVLKQTFHVVPQDFLFPFNGRPIDGLIGGDLLSQFALWIDYPAHEIGWIQPGNMSQEDAARMGFSPQNMIVLGQERDPRTDDKVNHYSLRAKFESGSHSASEELIVDTGAPDTLISNKLAQKLHLPVLSTRAIAILSSPIIPANRSTVEKMQIGQLSLSQVAVTAPQEKDTGFPPLLGENVLSDCVVLLDFGPHRFYLRPVLPPVKPEMPLEKTQIVWDRLRAAPDLPSVEEMLSYGFAPNSQNTLAEQVSKLRMSQDAGAKGEDIERFEKLAVLLHEGQDEVGAKAAYAEAVDRASLAVRTHPDDGVFASQLVEALNQAGRDEAAAMAANQITTRLPAYAPGWRLLGTVLTFRIAHILGGEPENITEDKAIKLQQQTQNSQPDVNQTAQIQTLLLQAHFAINKAVALSPLDPDSYRARGGFCFVRLCALQALQQAKQKIDLPASEAPAAETSLAEALADWQRCAELSPNNVEQLSATAYLDASVPVFCDRVWLTKYLKGTGYTLPAALMTTESVQSRLTRLTQSPDKSAASSAWIALGKSEAGDAKTASAAEKSWRQALALDPAQSEALGLLVSSLYHADRWKDLQDLLSQQCKISDSVPLRLTLASVLNGGGQLAEAETQVRAALTLAPENAAANLTLAEMLLARSANDPKALAEASTCLGKARLGYATLASPAQKATLTTTQAVWLALDHDPATAEKQLIGLAQEQPNCTQVREALAALVTY